MQEVEDEEAANMKAFLKQLNLEPKAKAMSTMGLESVAEANDILNRNSIANDYQVSGDRDIGGSGSKINEEDGL